MQSPEPDTHLEGEQMAATQVRIPRQPKDIGGLLAVPEVEGRFPAVVVIPTIRGVDEFAGEVVERLAGEGFVALAVDIFDHPGVPEDIFKRPGAQPDQEILGDLDAAFALLQKDARVIPEAICAWGYCIGGRFSLLWPTYRSELAGAAAFHGFPTNDTGNPNTPTEPAGRVAQLQVPVIANFGEADKLVPMSEVERYRSELEKHAKDAEVHTYPGRDHGWTGQKNPSYHAKDAETAWRRSIQFLTRRIAARAKATAPSA
jgi:carboxymethylenebutenolidase